MSADLDRAVRTVVRQCMGVSPGEDVLVLCNPVTEELGALMRIEAQGDGADATLAVTAVAGAGVFWFMFHWLLGIPMPAGLLAWT